MLLRIGVAGLRGSIDRYARRFDLLEVRAERGALPRTGRLSRWVDGVGTDFAFSVKVGARVGELVDTGEDRAYALEVVRALGARWVVVQTPPRVSPSARHREALGAVFESLGGAASVAWEPHGPWTDDDAEAWAGEVGVTLVRDLTVAAPPAGDAVYTRLRRFGGGGRVSLAAAERVGHALAGRKEGFVVIEGTGATRAAEIIRLAAGDVPEEVSS